MLRYVALYCLPYFTLHSLQTTPNLTLHCIELQYGESHWLVCPRFSHIRMGIAGWPFGHESVTWLSKQVGICWAGMSILQRMQSLPADMFLGLPRVATVQNWQGPLWNVLPLWAMWSFACGRGLPIWMSQSFTESFRYLKWRYWTL